MIANIFFDRQNPSLMSISRHWRLIFDAHAPCELVIDNHCLMVKKRGEPKVKGVFVDFVSGAADHRRKFGGGRNQAIAKAVGLKKGLMPTVVDGTAGLGRDAFVLTSLGCKVTMVERHPVVAALLDDGLRRGYQDENIGPWLRQRLRLLHGSSLTELAKIDDQIEVVYLDPMYPPRQKSALVKKEMRVFHSLVGADTDADDLLPSAIALAKRRVVVKRPAYAKNLNHIPPTMVINTKKNRFDVYLNTASTNFTPEFI